METDHLWITWQGKHSAFVKPAEGKKGLHPPTNKTEDPITSMIHSHHCLHD